MQDPEVRRQVRALTNRVRQAVKMLPKDINYAQSYEGQDGLVLDDLQEIVGAATLLADLLGLEL